MKVEMYSVYDKKSRIYQQPMFTQNRGTAIRDMHDFLKGRGKETMMSKYPDDYQLIYIGNFGEESGCLSAPDKCEIVCELADLIEKESPND